MKNSTILQRLLHEQKKAIQTFDAEDRERNKDYYEGVLAGIRACIQEMYLLEQK